MDREQRPVQSFAEILLPKLSLFPQKSCFGVHGDRSTSDLSASSPLIRESALTTPGIGFVSFVVDLYEVIDDSGFSPWSGPGTSPKVPLAG